MVVGDEQRTLSVSGGRSAGTRHLPAVGDDRVRLSPRRRPYLPNEAIAALANHLGWDRAATERRTLDCTPWAGAYNRARPDATAFVQRAERFLLKHEVDIAATAFPARAAGSPGLADVIVGTRAPTRRRVPNFPDADLDDPTIAYYVANRPRLQAVKAA